MVEGEMLFIPARAANLPINNKPVMLLSLVFAPTWLGLSFYDSRTTSLLHPARQIQLPSLQRGEGEAMLTALTHLSRSPLEQNIIQPLVLSLLHLCRNVVNMPPGNSQPRGDFLYHSICNWVQDNYAQPLTRESVAQFFNITPNHLSKLFAQHGTMRFYRICALGANGEGEDDFARNIICRFMKWRSVAAFRTATIFVASSGVSLA
ncbi:AraC family transcriptional regulator [Escherichia coli]|uniref:AraC family transcriptional regulator n=1 Tax=Escherichia coli TaxID=562 RepID=A0A447XU75_ECOLX|nr:AraC family transcriptional regulator [Escherichia coli]